MYFDRNIQLKPANKNFWQTKLKIRPIICAIKAKFQSISKVLVLYFKRHENRFCQCAGLEQDEAQKQRVPAQPQIAACMSVPVEMVCTSTA